MTTVQKLYWLIAAGGSIIFAVLSLYSPVALYFFIFCLLYGLIGFYDLYHSPHTLNRLYPVLAYLRYFSEHIRPGIQQYFVADNLEERPFDREERDLIYRRAKGVRDTLAFGTERDILDTGYIHIQHSIKPLYLSENNVRVNIGGPDCRQPYSSSLLNISAMSFGALSDHAILALNKGAAMGNFAHNTGEGGISPYHRQFKGDLIWQIGTGYFGCRDEQGNFSAERFEKKAVDPQIKMIEVKLSQGAKPAHGGLLPAAKVSAEIASIREVPIATTCHSPAAHTAFDSPEGLLRFIQQLRTLSGGKPTGFKLCIGIRSEFMSICKAMLKTGITPDFITIDGAEGGTGAAPVEFSNYLGTPCNEAIYFVHNCLIGCGLRNRVKIIASGKTASGFDMLIKCALGADVVNAARSMMLALGCVQSRTCNSNECPTGIATQDKKRSKALDVEAKSHRVLNYQKATVKSLLELVGAMGLDNPSKLQAHHLHRRIDDETTRHYDEIYTPLKPRELLNDEINPQYASDWHKADSEHF
ncbi:MAG: FMN-binding glutamate synthase family protein [Pseudomonadales bacterium]|nr:FMN-binding glutamate synthase family protein [Pseudomonadales bacterium]